MRRLIGELLVRIGFAVAGEPIPIGQRPPVIWKGILPPNALHQAEVRGYGTSGTHNTQGVSQC